MATPVIQTSFNSGEWAPALNARVDLAKYRSGASLLQNFFVDYRGGATTRPGTKFINRCKSSSTVRLIPFQASFTVSYVLEFGEGYIRFYSSGSPILEAAVSITSATAANPGVFTKIGHGLSNGDWIYLSGFTGGTWGTNLNGNYYIVTGVAGNDFSLTDLYGTSLNTTGFGVFTAGNFQRVYTVTTTYTATELADIKYAQNVNVLVLCHPNHAPATLTLNSAASWTLANITFGSTVSAPTGLGFASTYAGGAIHNSYIVTAVDSNGQESGPSSVLDSGGLTIVAGGSATLTWTAVTGAASYNVYKTIYRNGAALPAGAQFGFICNVTNNTAIDSGLNADFSQGYPLVQNPFSGSGVQSVAVTAAGTYAGLAFPSVSFTGGGGSGAAATATLQTLSVTLVSGGTSKRYAVNDTITLYYGIVVRVTAVFLGDVTAIVLVNGGSVTGSPIAANPYPQVSTSGVGLGVTVSVTIGVTAVGITSAGTGYGGAPTVVFSSGAAAATATLGSPSSGNPTVPGFHAQRLFLGAPPGSPSQFNMSQPGAPYNFNTSFPLQPDDAIQQTLTNTTLNTIQSVVSVSGGLVVIADKGAWLLNGGSQGSALSALDLVANPQAYSGSSGLPPIVTPNDILYVQSKNSIVRDLAYNFYLNNYVGADISVISSHLFYTYQISEWAWAEEPYKIVWGVRNDGILLSLTFLKEQELIAWAHSNTTGSFISVASVTEQVSFGSVDAVYVVVRRTINSQTVQYVERMVELTYPQGYISSWQVDAGIGYSGAAATTFSGAQHLANAVVTGVADGTVINFTMPANGTFIFGPGGTTGLTGITNASVVTVGLAFTPILGTLTLDLGEPTVQGKQKAVTGVTLRVANTLGLKAGKDPAYTDQKVIKDLEIGQVGSLSNEVVSDLVTSDAFITLPPQYDAFGIYYITQPNPYPASILGVIPEITVGDSPK